jgi:hypothetical protein
MVGTITRTRGSLSGGATIYFVDCILLVKSNVWSRVVGIVHVYVTTPYSIRPEAKDQTKRSSPARTIDPVDRRTLTTRPDH